jgi:hypothetical protein
VDVATLSLLPVGGANRKSFFRIIAPRKYGGMQSDSELVEILQEQMDGLVVCCLLAFICPQIISDVRKSRQANTN